MPISAQGQRRQQERWAAARRELQKKKYEKAINKKKTGFLRPNIEKLKAKSAVERLTNVLKYRQEYIRELAARALSEMECWKVLFEAGKALSCITCGKYGLKPPFSNDIPKDWHDVAERSWKLPSEFERLVQSETVKVKYDMGGPVWAERTQRGIPPRTWFLCPDCFRKAVQKDNEISSEYWKTVEDERRNKEEKWQKDPSVEKLLKDGPDQEDTKSHSIFQWLKKYEGRQAHVSYITNFSENLARSYACTLAPPKIPFEKLCLVYHFQSNDLVLPLDKDFIRELSIEEDKLILTQIFHSVLRGDDYDKYKNRWMHQYPPTETFEIIILDDKQE